MMAGLTCVRDDSERVQIHADQAQPVDAPGPTQDRGVCNVMQRAANSERAKRIVPALSQQTDAFRCVKLCNGCPVLLEIHVVQTLLSRVGIDR